MSVEGSVLARKEGGILDRTKIHSVALTFTPANKETLTRPIYDMNKSDTQPNWEVLRKSISVSPTAPSFIESDDISQMIKITTDVVQLIREVANLKKALTAGYPAGDSSGLVGGAVLQTGHLAKKVTCGECGKNQLVLKNQLKCSHCSQPFTMEKIASFLLNS